MAAGSGGSWFEPGKYLVRHGFTTQDQLDRAHRQSGDAIERLLSSGEITEEDASKARDACRANERGLAYVDLDRVHIGFPATICLPSDLARDIGALPLKLDGPTLWVAFRDPFDKRAIARAEVASGCRVIPVAASAEPLQAALDRL